MFEICISMLPLLQYILTFLSAYQAFRDTQLTLRCICAELHQVHVLNTIMSIIMIHEEYNHPHKFPTLLHVKMCFLPPTQKCQLMYRNLLIRNRVPNLSQLRNWTT